MRDSPSENRGKTKEINKRAWSKLAITYYNQGDPACKISDIPLQIGASTAD
jgi:hypothetical protein